MPQFKPGDLVRIKSQTHEEGMPDHRVAVIVEAEDAFQGEVFSVLFLGSDKPMRFHQMFLEPFTVS